MKRRLTLRAETNMNYPNYHNNTLKEMHAVYTQNDMEEMREGCRREVGAWKFMAICGFSLAAVFMIVNVILINLL